MDSSDEPATDIDELDLHRCEARDAGDYATALALAGQIADMSSASLSHAAIKARLLVELEEPDRMEPAMIAGRLITSLANDLTALAERHGA